MTRKNFGLVLILCSWAAATGQIPAITKKDFLADHIDTTISPSTDFYQYANGGWIKKNPIPQNSTGWGSFLATQEEISNRYRKIIESMIGKKYPEGSNEQKIRDYWVTAMDSIKANQQALQPLRSSFDKINRIKTIHDLFDVIAVMFRKRSLYVLFFNYPTGNDYFITAGGLTMGERFYYFDNDEQSVRVRTAFKNFLTKTFMRLEKDSVKAKMYAEEELELETRLAKAYGSESEKKMSLHDLSVLTPEINWQRYLQKIGIDKLDSIIVGKPAFFKALNAELKNTPIHVWKNHLRFQLVYIYARMLDDIAFNNLSEYREAFTGPSQPLPRWKRVLARETTMLGDALIQLYVHEYFDEKILKRYTALAEEIRKAFAERIKRLEWMSDSTKQGALDKIKKMDFKFGFPDKWKDYSDLKISRDSWLANEMSAGEWLTYNSIKKLKKPVDKSEWSISANLMDAQYFGDKNRVIVSPGAIIAPGLKDEELDDAFVYGYTGALIGHEVAHGFDTGNIGYDGDGNEKNWWTEKDLAEFKERIKAIIKQYDEFGHGDININYGKNFQKENMADLVGLLISIDAFMKTDAYKENKMIGGFTPMQRFFIGYAYRWLGEQTKESEVNYIKTGSRGIPRERVNAPVVNTNEFYDAFNIKPGDKMYRPENLRVRIW